MKTDIDRTPRQEADVCVVGAGVAGGLVAQSLARRGHDVVILEAGPRFDRSSRLERMERALRPDIDPSEVWNMGGQRDEYTSSGGVDYELNRTRVKGVGGTTLHWLGTTPRLHEKDFEMRTRYGIADDWPIGYEDLRPYYAAAERELGVAGATDNPFAPPRETDYPMEAFPPSRSDSLFAEACAELGIAVHSVPQARNSSQYDGRSKCLGYSTCTPVCPSGAKYSGDVHVKKAEAEGVDVIDTVPVQRLEHTSDGDRISAAVYLTPEGDEYRQEADLFVLACGGVETPRLMLLSQSDQHPDGLGNANGLVGSYFMEHPIVRTVAELEQPANQNPIGFHSSASQEFYGRDGPDLGSIYLLFENMDPESPHKSAIRGDDSPQQNLLDPLFGDDWGDALTEHGSDAAENRTVAIDAAVEMLPRASNQVALDSTKTDDHGSPVPDVSFEVGTRGRDSLRRALDINRRIIEEMGGRVTGETSVSNPRFSAHHMGTTRMGQDPQESVVNSQCQVHGVENLFISSSSVFVTSGAVNPTLTIAALSLRLADHIHETVG